MMETSQSSAKKEETDILTVVKEDREKQAVVDGASLNSTYEGKDTVELATKFKEAQGYHETEVSFGGEGDLHKSFLMCTKNPDHTCFIPIADFKVEHLPPPYRDNDIVDFIKAQGELTVRLSLEHISDKRPQFFGDSEEPFPFFDFRGKSGILITGSGWVSWVCKKMQGNCMCYECLTSESVTPKMNWGRIDILTAAHVVWDDTEAARTSCHFLYDKGGPDLNNVLTFRGLKVGRSNIKGDYCRLEYYTHDMELLNKLDNMLKHCYDLEKKVYDKYGSFNKRNGPCHSDSHHRLSVCVSHPHGCSKQVSVGHVTHKETVDSYEMFESTRYTYNTPTCPGSSGAPVFTLGYGGMGWSVSYSGLYHAHSKGYPGNMNMSVVRLESV